MKNQQNNSNYVNNKGQPVVQTMGTESNKLKKIVHTCLTISTVCFVVGAPLIGFGSIFSQSVQIIQGVLVSGFIILILLVISWLTYKSGYYKKTLYFLILPLVLDILVIGLLAWLLVGQLFTPRIPTPSDKVIVPSDTTSTNTSVSNTLSLDTAVQQPLNNNDHKFGIMTVSYPKNISVGKAIVAKVNGTDYVPQPNTTFTNNSQYVMYFSGISGFTEYHPYNAPAAFVDVKGSVVLYDETGTAIMRDDNVFSSYIGGIPVKDFTAVTLRLTLGKNFKKGNYRWESIVTNNKNENDYLKGSVNFIVN